VSSADELQGPVSPYFAVTTRDGIFDMLMQLKRVLLPAHTEESLEDPLVAELMVWSFEGQRQAAMLDMAARELTMDCRRRSSLVALAELHGLLLPGYRPARALVLADVSASAPDAVTVVPSLFQVATRGSLSSSIVFEGPDDAVVSASLALAAVLRHDASAGTYATFTPPTWASPDEGDALYFLHETLAWNAVRFAFPNDGFPEGTALSFEYYEGHQIVGEPDLVTYDSDDGTLAVALATFLDGADCAGLEVRVTCLDTGLSETVTVNAINGATVSNVLGQSTPSLDPSRYAVSAAWRPLTWIMDADPVGAVAGEVVASWTLPFDATHRWVPGTVNGLTGFWVRMRLTEASGGDLVVTPAASPDDATYTAVVECVQGQTTEDRLGTSNGNADQELLLAATPIEGSLDAITVDGVEWPIVETLYGLGPAARAAVLRERPDGRFSVRLGNGTEDGAKPPLNAVLVATYRTGAERNGNVGAGAIQVNRTGAALLSNIRNPTPAAGWVVRMADPSLGDAGLEAAKRWVAGEVRTPRGIRVPAAVEDYVEALELADGSSPVERAALYEETGGYNTAELRVVGGGGALLAPEVLDEIALALNGRTVSGVRVGGVADTNLRYDVQNYVPQALTVTISVEVEKGYARGVRAAVEAAARAYLLPTARRADGSYIHALGGTVRALAVRTTAAAVVDRLLSLDVTLAGPAGAGTPDVSMVRGGLPDPDPESTTITVTVVEVDPEEGA